MTVVDVNTGKYTGSGGNLEETVTRNNLEAAEEVVRQLRLRDIGGIIVVDFIDMVLESNRDLVLRRLVECLGRDRTRHQVAEVTSLGLVQMTRKRIGTGLLESFSVDCDHCKGRGVVIADAPVEPKKDDGPRRGGRGGRSRRRPATVAEQRRWSGGNQRQRRRPGQPGNGGEQRRPQQKHQAPSTRTGRARARPAEPRTSSQRARAAGRGRRGQPARRQRPSRRGRARIGEPGARQHRSGRRLAGARRRPLADAASASKPAGPPPPVLTDEGQAP